MWLAFAIGVGVGVGACTIDPLDLTGKPCPCPSGWSCDTATNTCARARDAGDCTGDRDDDGIGNCDDICPDAADPAQFDEDGDGRGDACDVCPGDRDDGADGDGDEVGDACDPNPMQPIDRIVLFEGFHAGVPSTWRTAGTWASAGDDIAVESADGVIGWLVVDDPVPTGVSHLVTQVTIGAQFDPLGSSVYVGLARSFDPATDDSVRCLVGIRTIMTPPAFAIRDTGGVNLSVETPYPFDVGMTERIVFTQNAQTYACSTATAVLTDAMSPVAPNAPYVGLRVRSASASYAWMMLVTSN